MRPIAAVCDLLRKRDFLRLMAAFTLPALAGWVVKAWMPAILGEQFGLGQGRAGVSAVLSVVMMLCIRPRQTARDGSHDVS